MSTNYRFLVTGGAGFIGSNIAEYLLKEGYTVRIFDNFMTGKEENIEDFSLRFGERFEFVRGDLRVLEDVRKAVEDVDFVLHHAALPSVPASLEDPLLANEINVTGTLNLLVAAKDSRPKRIVFASSTAVYGDPDFLPVSEDAIPNPKSPYALHKLTGERYMRMFQEYFGIQTISLRYFNVFGPRQDPASMYAAVIPKFIEKILAGEPPTIYGDGKQTRDFVFIDNVVKANLKACFAPESACGMAYNIASGESHSLLDLIDVLCRIVDNEVSPVFEPPRPGDIRDSHADISLARERLGYEVEVDFEEGLRRTVEWYSSALKSETLDSKR